jgi:hypothetical protein
LRREDALQRRSRRSCQPSNCIRTIRVLPCRLCVWRRPLKTMVQRGHSSLTRSESCLQRCSTSPCSLRRLNLTLPARLRVILPQQCKCSSAAAKGLQHPRAVLKEKPLMAKRQMPPWMPHYMSPRPLWRAEEDVERLCGKRCLRAGNIGSHLAAARAEPGLRPLGDMSSMWVHG